MAETSQFSLRNGSPSFVPRGFATREGFSKSVDPRPDDGLKTPRNFTNASAELTRNSNYVVSKLVATPNALKSSARENVTGLINETTSHALLISDSSVSVWKYNSSDNIPVTINLPVAPANAGFPPIAHLVSPNPGSSDPGVVIINSRTGHVRYYDNIETASSIGLLQHHRGIDAQIRLSDREIIVSSESIEPAGILLATSTGRVFLVSLRDAAGNPNITLSEIVRRQSSFFTFSLSPQRQIAAIKAGAVLGQGSRIAITVTRGGEVVIRSCARGGQSNVILQQNIHQSLVEHLSLDEQYKGVDIDKNLEIVDLALLNNFDSQDVFLVLTNIKINANENSYVTFVIRRDDTQLLLFSAYRVRTYYTPYTKQPQLYVPSPGSTAFIIFEDAIVLTQLPTELDHVKNNRLRKWEDVITFRHGLKIVGSGIENYLELDKEILKLPSAYVLIPEIGVLRIERLPQDESKLYDESHPSVLKSHIEQAVFYGGENLGPLEFDLPEGIQIDSVELKQGLLEVATEIMNSNSAYLPPRLSSIESHLQLRQSKLKRLLEYTASNFSTIIDEYLVIQLVRAFEKVTAAHDIYKVLEKSNTTTAVNTIVDQAVQTFSTPNGDFFHAGLTNINEFILMILKSLNKTGGNEAFAVELLTRAFIPVLEAEKVYRYGLFKLDDSFIGSEEPWFAANDVYFDIDEAFEKYATITRPSLPNAVASQMCVELTEILFYDLQQRLKWLKSKVTKSKADQAAIEQCETFYKARSTIWTKTLVVFGSKIEALAIAETYQDLQSLAEISDGERETAKGVELDNIHLRFDYYFNKFGYAFAETLYNYYIHTGKYQVLILGFQEYSEYLKRFFTENDHRKISWARDILDGDYTKAADILLSVSQKSTEKQTHKHLQLSIAKLSALADVNQNVDLIQDIQEELDFADAQSSIFDQISQFIRSDSDPAAQTDAIVSELLQQQYKNDVTIKHTSQRALNRLLGNKSVSVNELIDIFTLIDSKITQNSLNCFYALKVLHLSSQPEREKVINERLIWTRALLADDWESIIASENKSDEWIKERSESTVLFTTLLNFFKDHVYTVNNDYQISLPDVTLLANLGTDEELLSRFTFIGDEELQALKKELNSHSSVIDGLISSANLEGWVKALIGTANEKSGADKVINYSQLIIQNP